MGKLQTLAEVTVGSFRVRLIQLLPGSLLCLLLGTLWPLSSAWAAPLCRTVAHQQICVLKITRSAKYYWEYRAVVQVGDIRRPMGRYNCRTGEYLDRRGKSTADDVGTRVICSLFKS